MRLSANIESFCFLISDTVQVRAIGRPIQKKGRKLSIVIQVAALNPIHEPPHVVLGHSPLQQPAQSSNVMLLFGQASLFTCLQRWRHDCPWEDPASKPS